jgi:hypothetical protein
MEREATIHPGAWSEMSTLVERYRKEIEGVLSCFDRVVIQGMLPNFNHAEGMTGYLCSQGIRIFDYNRFAEGLRDRVRENAERTAREAGLEIEFVRKAHVRKEDIVAAALKKRGEGPGLVCILSAMERCQAYKPWHNKETHRTYLRSDDGKCLHYYFYMVDETLGLCYLRVPTWCPFRLQFYFNGHNWLAAKLRAMNIGYTMLDNAFVTVDDMDAAQGLANEVRVETVHRILDRYAAQFCPAAAACDRAYHWTLMQVEYATDIVFRRQEDLQGIYDTLVRTAIHTVKPENIATFLGRKLNGNYADELGTRYNVRIEGSRIKHSMGKASIKMYDKHKRVLRIETTADDVTFFKHYREVVQRDGTSRHGIAHLKKTIYSLYDLAGLLRDSNWRYLLFISQLEDRRAGTERLNKVAEPVEANGRTYPGINFFSAEDTLLMETIVRGEFTISGFQNRHLRKHVRQASSSRISRLLKRLRVHGLIKRIGNTYKYYLTELGRAVALTGLKLKNLVIIPALCAA